MGVCVYVFIWIVSCTCWMCAPHIQGVCGWIIYGNWPIATAFSFSFSSRSDQHRDAERERAFCIVRLIYIFLSLLPFIYTFFFSPFFVPFSILLLFCFTQRLFALPPSVTIYKQHLPRVDSFRCFGICFDLFLFSIFFPQLLVCLVLFVLKLLFKTITSEVKDNQMKSAESNRKVFRILMSKEKIRTHKHCSTAITPHSLMNVRAFGGTILSRK